MTRILIADDHAILRLGLMSILKEGFPFAYIEEAEDAERVIQKTIDQQWNLLICDVSMPGRSGLDVLTYIRQTAPQLPVLILSMHPEEQYAVRALKAGAAGYLSKEATYEEIIGAVQRILSGKKYISPATAEKLASGLGLPAGEKLHETLSDREFEVFLLIANGKSISDIANKLSLSMTTVSTYRSRILAKFDMKSNADLTKYALENQLI